jgi:hypothetical protein
MAGGANVAPIPDATAPDGAAAGPEVPDVAPAPGTETILGAATVPEAEGAAPPLPAPSPQAGPTPEATGATAPQEEA